METSNKKIDIDIIANPEHDFQTTIRKCQVPRHDFWKTRLPILGHDFQNIRLSPENDFRRTINILNI